MPDVKSGTLRVYCLCGQKMKVSEKMYGLPGKCIACRQKIRIPRRDEVPEGTTEIHLRDHPEFLRGKPKAAAMTEEEREAKRALAAAKRATDGEDGDSTPNTELDLLESPPVAESTKSPPLEKPPRSASSIPLDPLLPLQVLCSLDYKLSRQLDTLQLDDHEDEVLLAELEGHLSRVRKARRRLDDHLHQVLMESAIELANTHEKLAQLKLSTRVGEVSWSEFRDTVHKLRVRRDRLERRQQNLRGWLAAKDPYLAGGLLDLSIESIPNDDTPISLPPEPEGEGVPLAWLTAGLREAFEQRATVRQRLDEVQRMGDSREAEELKKEITQQRLLARARVGFYQDRLQQLKKDYTSDLETATAALTVARDKLRVDEMTREDYDALDREILRSKKDIARAQSIIARALGANSASDVPSPKGTFLERLGVSDGAPTGADAIAGYAAVLLLVASIFAPSIGTKSLISTAIELGDSAGASAWLFLLPIALAAIAGMASPLPDRRWRGWLLISGGGIGIVAGAYLIHEGGYGFGSVASRFRTGAAWYLQPGIALYLLGTLAMAGGGTLALWSWRTMRPWVLAAAGLALLSVVIITTDFFGASRPRPGLSVELAADPIGAGVIRVTNSGGRPVHLLVRPSDARDGYRFLLERRVGPSSYAPASGEGPMFAGGRAGGGNSVLFTVPSGGAQEIPFVLEPGEYRVTLEQRMPGSTLEQQFTITAPAPEAAPAVNPGTQIPATVIPPAAETQAPVISPTADASTAEQPAGDESAPIESTGGPEVNLTGIIASNGDPPQFNVDLTFEDGVTQRITIGLGGTVWDGWIIGEFNPDERTITLEREGRFLILRRGAPLAL